MIFTEEEVKAALSSALPGFVAEEWVSAGLIPDLLKITNALPTKREGEPIDMENVREGDHVRGIRPGHVTGSRSNPARREATIVGEVYKSLDGRLVIGGAYLENLADLSLIRRATPPLPIEPGSLIEAYEVRGIKGKWRLVLDCEDEWRSFEIIGGYRVHIPRDITAWKPADFVVRDENE